MLPGVFIIYIFMILVEHRDVIVHNVLGMSELREVVQNAEYPPDLLGSKRFVEEPSGEDLSGVVLLLHELEHPAVELGGKAAREPSCGYIRACPDCGTQSR